MTPGIFPKYNYCRLLLTILWAVNKYSCLLFSIWIWKESKEVDFFFKKRKSWALKIGRSCSFFQQRKNAIFCTSVTTEHDLEQINFQGTLPPSYSFMLIKKKLTRRKHTISRNYLNLTVRKILGHHYLSHRQYLFSFVAVNHWSATPRGPNNPPAPNLISCEERFQ